MHHSFTRIAHGCSGARQSGRQRLPTIPDHGMQELTSGLSQVRHAGSTDAPRGKSLVSLTFTHTILGRRDRQTC